MAPWLLRLIPAFPAALLAALSCLAGPALRAEDCQPDGLCRVASGQYRLYRPPAASPGALPALMHFHGYQESAADMMAREDLRAFADRHGVLLVMPDGIGGAWSHPGSPAQDRDEFRFVDEVVADLVARAAIDRGRFLVSGFSIGAAMVWNLACERGETFTAFLAIAGTFWLPQPEACPSGAQNLIHIHGVADDVVPLEGRTILRRFRQGDVIRAVGMMARANRCAPEAARAHRAGALACQTHAHCASGKWLELCLHPGGHDFDARWLDFAWARLEAFRKG